MSLLLAMDHLLLTTLNRNNLQVPCHLPSLSLCRLQSTIVHIHHQVTGTAAFSQINCFDGWHQDGIGCHKDICQRSSANNAFGELPQPLR